MDFFIFIQIQNLIEYSISKQWRHSAASDLGLRWLPMCQQKDARLIWVKVQNLLSSHGGILTYAMHHHREKINSN